MIHTVQSLRQQQYIELIKLIPPPKFIQSGLLSGFERFLIIQIDFLYFHYNLELQRTLKPLNISNLYTAEQGGRGEICIGRAQQKFDKSSLIFPNFS